MIEATPEDYATISRLFVEAGWVDRSLVSGESFDTHLTELGQARLLQLEAILQELGPLCDGEHSALEALALDFAKQHKKRKGL